ncbi:hypothetical protein LJC59_04705 [Desulfovibrio sp. OttesenSCG-928-A18]|nr:hypothetical protein [Desulfovibrio sp. OttesenSCG-928-A18]
MFAQAGTARGLVLFFCLCLLASLRLPGTASSEARAGTGTASFAASGLLISPDESAEAILLRAHQLDADAMLLAVLGYADGRGGFPKAVSLGTEWHKQLLAIGAFEAAGIAWARVWSETDFRRIPSMELFAAHMANCSFARSGSSYAALKKAEIFDFEPFCTDLETQKQKYPGWEGPYNN